MKKFLVAWVTTVVADLVVVFFTSKLITDGVINDGLIVFAVVNLACPLVESCFLLVSRQFQAKGMLKNMYMAQLVSVVVAALLFWRFSSALELTINDYSALLFGFIILSPVLKFWLINDLFPLFPFFHKSESEESSTSVKQKSVQ